MSDKARKLKDDASKLLARGRLPDATLVYEKVVKLEAKDLSARQKLAELYARQGRVHDAVREYQGVAGSYAADGLLLKAIAVCKIILQIEPSHLETQNILAELSTKRRGDASAVEMPKSMSAALGGKRSASDIRGMPSAQLRPKSAVTASGGVAPAAGAGLPRTNTTPFAASTRPTPAGEKPAVAVDDVDVLEVQNDAPLAIASVSASIQTLRQHAAARRAPPPPPPAETSSPRLPRLSGFQEIGMDDVFEAPAAIAFDTSGTAANDEAEPTSNVVEIDASDDSAIIEVEPAHIDVDKVPPIPLFSDLPKQAFIALTERMHLHIANAGDVLMREGEPGSSMFIIIQGRVQVVRKSDDASDIVLAELGDGAFFGEMSLLSFAPRTASVVCLEEAMLFEISVELLNDITREHPMVADVMRRFHRNRLLTNLLKTSPIFAPFSVPDKKVLIEKFKSRAVTAGTELLTRERPGDGLYVVLQGRCVVSDLDDAGASRRLAELRDGDVFGEMSMLWHKETCATVTATTPCIVLRLPRDAFNEVIMTHPQILEVLSTLSTRREQHNQDMRHSVLEFVA